MATIHNTLKWLLTFSLLIIMFEVCTAQVDVKGFHTLVITADNTSNDRMNLNPDSSNDVTLVGTFEFIQSECNSKIATLINHKLFHAMGIQAYNDLSNKEWVSKWFSSRSEQILRTLNSNDSYIEGTPYHEEHVLKLINNHCETISFKYDIILKYRKQVTIDTRYICFDQASGQEISTEILFLPHSDKEISPLIYEELGLKVANTLFNEILPINNFRLAPSGLVFMLNQNDAKISSLGQVSCSIPYEKVKEMFQTDWIKRLVK